MILRELASICLLAAASAQPASPPVPVPVGERIEVRLGQLDVVVRDKKGALVTGLGPAEFIVTEDGSPMEIVAVDEWGSGRAPTAEPPKAETPTPQPGPPPSGESGAAEPERRSFVIVFDALGDTTALRMNQAKRAAVGFIRSHLRADDLAAVYQLDLSLHALSGVTSNAGDLQRAIEKITWMPASSMQDEIAESVLSSTMSAFAPLMKERLSNQSVNAAQQLDWQREHVYDALDRVAASFGALPGRRVLVLVSPGFPMTTAGDLKTGSGGFTPRFRQLIRSLAEYGVTAYALDIGNDLPIGDASQTIDWRIAVGKLGMDENTLSDLGLERSMGSASASARREFLGVIASESGGRLLTHSDLSKAFDAIDEEASHFYRISCRLSVTRGGDRYRRLRVSVKTPGYVVTGRRGRYSDITPASPKPGGSKPAVESLDRYRPLTARGTAIPLPTSDPKKVPVDVVVEALGPIDLPIDAEGKAALDVEFRLVARAEGEIVDRYERSFTARVKPDGVDAIRKAFRIEGRLVLVPGIYEMQSSIRLGEPPQLASWTATVAVPPPPKGSAPAFDGLVLSSETDAGSPLLSRPNLPEAMDPLTLKPGARILPSTYDAFDAGGNLLALFWLKGLPAPGDTPPQLDLTVTAVDEHDQPKTLPFTLLFFGTDSSGGYRALARVDTAALSPGGYSLRWAAGLKGGDLPPAHRTVPVTLRAKENSGASPTSSSVPAP